MLQKINGYLCQEPLKVASTTNLQQTYLNISLEGFILHVKKGELEGTFRLKRKVEGEGKLFL